MYYVETRLDGTRLKYKREAGTRLKYKREEEKKKGWR